MTRTQLIAAGKVWRVSYDAAPDDTLFEGRSRSACLKFIREKFGMREYKQGTIRLGKVLWEDGPKQNT